MLLFADCQHRLGVKPALHEIVAADGRTLKQSFDAMFNVLAPCGMIPPVGDAYSLRIKLWENPSYEYAWGLWHDPKHGWLVSKNPKPSSRYLFITHSPESVGPPAIRSILLPEHGYVFLRSHENEAYWSDEARCAFLTYDRRRVHANADKLSLMMFGEGKMLLSDVEGKATVPHAFSSRIQNELNRGGLSQNTVMIDGRDQRGTPDLLTLIEYHDLPAEKRVTAADRRGVLYEGVRQQRTICLTEGYCLDVFQVMCDSPRQIDWIMHILDEKTKRTAGPETRPCEPLGKDGAWAWLRDFRSSRQDRQWHAAWRSGDVHLRLDMPGCPGTEIVECGYPATDEPATGRIPMLIVRRKAASTVFAAVYTFGRSGPGDVTLTVLPDRDGRLAFEVEAPAGRGVHLVPRLAPPG